MRLLHCQGLVDKDCFEVAVEIEVELLQASLCLAESRLALRGCLKALQGQNGMIAEAAV
jgi:hypothetical protein